MRRVIHGGSLLLLVLLLGTGHPKAAAHASAVARDVAVLKLSESDVATVHIHAGGTVLSFTARPSKVIVGREGQFDIQYVEDDVAVVALTPNAKANLYVYVQGRRYSFNLIAAAGAQGQRILMVRDPQEERVKVDVK